MKVDRVRVTHGRQGDDGRQFSLGYEAQLDPDEALLDVRRDMLEWAMTDVERLLGNCGDDEEIVVTRRKIDEKPF